MYFKLWNQGYVKINSVISKEEASTIKRNFENNLSNLRPQSKRWTEFSQFEYMVPPFGDENAIVWSNIGARNKNIDKILNKIFTNKVLNQLFNTNTRKKF